MNPNLLEAAHAHRVARYSSPSLIYLGQFVSRTMGFMAGGSMESTSPWGGNGDDAFTGADKESLGTGQTSNN